MKWCKHVESFFILCGVMHVVSYSNHRMAWGKGFDTDVESFAERLDARLYSLFLDVSLFIGLLFKLWWLRQKQIVRLLVMLMDFSMFAVWFLDARPCVSTYRKLEE